MANASQEILTPGNRYLNRALLALVIIAALGFTAFSALQGFDFAAYPAATHAHALAMAGWLVLLGTQSMLGSSGKIALHKRLGWLGAALAVVVVGTGIAVSLQTLSLGRVPPFFTPGYFLMLGLVNLTMFALFVGAGIASRKNTAWHRRFMLGSLLVVFEPVLGRVLPFFIVPAIGGPDNLMPFVEQYRMEFEIFRASVHLLIIAGVMVGDRLVTGRFHPVFGLALIAVFAFYLIVNFVGASVPFTEFAAGFGPDAS